MKKKDREWKDGVMNIVRECAENYPAIYVFSTDNMRNDAMKSLRDQLKDTSRFVMGSGKMMRAALGKTPSDEVRDGVSELGPYLKGPAGLFFTKLPREDVVQMFQAFAAEDYARAGALAMETVVIPEGTLHIKL